ncbi:MAG: carotenoid biosynthesis protein [Bacteroidales bacterium]|nr:carotenoid biosynthesis protein [Bacteroidales bacterium]MDD3736600.1 carotenoid biosynthesis protein [Bacteroidales bacterium]NLD63270.1 carotenoid biosynthesis protein [Bacteroidales bacterium]HNT93607.1 carotenoid biosynthesis protein [Bacteroidales bacterium]HOO65379.1 carotenoid biosynthesis protein [Bacteroidales bacterium]
MMVQTGKIPKPTEILIWVYAVGLAGMLLPFSRELFKLITPLNLLFAAGFLFWGNWPARRVILTGSFIAIASFFIEAAGTNTGKIFGVYSYGRTLGPALLNTPLIIGLNWFLLIYCTNVISRIVWQRLTHHSARRRGGLSESLFVILTGSALMVLYDLFLEPAAARLDMWSWECGVIPLRNYLGWFLFSAFFHAVTRIWGEEEINGRALPLFTVQLGFFASIDLFYAFAA